MTLTYKNLDSVLAIAQGLLEFGAPGSSITLMKTGDGFVIEQLIEMCYDTPDTGFVRVQKDDKE